MSLATTILIAFLESNYFTHLVNYLAAAKTQMYSFKGEWTGLMSFKPLSIEGYGAFMS